jgi:hypothetical protein
MAKRKGTEGQATQWPKEKEQKDKQHNGQKKRDRRTSNTMAKRKGTAGQATQCHLLLLVVCSKLLFSFSFLLRLFWKQLPKGTLVPRFTHLPS